MAKRVLILCLCFSSTLPWAGAYPNGAPEGSCYTLEPGHGATPQTTEFPYTVMVEKTKLRPGEPVKVSISAKGDTGFKGFLVVARRGGGGSVPQGMFKTDGSAEVNTRDCSDMQASAVTQTSEIEKRKVEFTWVAPQQDGVYMLATTIVQDKMTYWVGQLSESITVGDPILTPPMASTSPQNDTEMPTSRFGKLSEEAMQVYEGCGSTKGCFGFPGRCVQRKDCVVAMSYHVEEGKINMELTGFVDQTQASPYVAVGFSDDAKMGGDHVTGCRVVKERIEAREYQNVAGQKYNDKVERQVPILTGVSGSITDGQITCKFTLPTTFDVKELAKSYDLSKDEGSYYLLLARGSASGEDYLGKHPDDLGKTASSAKVNFLKDEVISESSNILIKLHGGFMIFAWLVMATTGKFIAKHFKHTHTGVKICGSDFWFLGHRLCMVMAVLMSLTAAILIFVEIGGYSEGTNLASKLHPALGVTVNTLAVLQIIGGLFRPHPGEKWRPYFNWGHWASGSTAIVLAVICIYLAMDLAKTNIHNATKYWVTLTTFIFFHVAMYLAITLHAALVHPSEEESIFWKLFGPMPRLKIEEELPGTTLRTALLIVYIIGAVICASLLTYFLDEALN